MTRKCLCGCDDHECIDNGWYVCADCPPGCHGTEPNDELAYWYGEQIALDRP